MPASDRELDLAAVPKAIRDAGFRPSDFEVHGIGTFEATTPECFRFRGWSQCYEVRNHPAGSESHQIRARVEVQDCRIVLERTQ